MATDVLYCTSLYLGQVRPCRQGEQRSVGLMSRPLFLRYFSPESLLCSCCVSSTNRARPRAEVLVEFVQTCGVST